MFQKYCVVFQELFVVFADMGHRRKLVYPDGQLAITLPGQPDDEFTLRKYKEDLCKPFNRITLYLCPEEPQQFDSDTEDESDTRIAR